MNQPMTIEPIMTVTIAPAMNYDEKQEYYHCVRLFESLINSIKINQLMAWWGTNSEQEAYDDVMTHFERLRTSFNDRTRRELIYAGIKEHQITTWGPIDI
jgi:hypothetical protein